MSGDRDSRAGLGALVHNTGWLLLDRALRIALVFGTSLLIARHLGPERYGTLAFAVALAMLVMEFSSLGLQGILVRELVLAPGERATLLGTTWLMRLGTGCVGAALAVGLAWLLKPELPETRLLVALVTGGLLLRAFEVVDLWLQAQERARHGAMARTVALLVVSVARVVLVLLDAPLWAYAAVAGAEYALLAAILSGVYLAQGERLGAWRARAAVARTLLHKSWPLVLSSIGVMIYLKIDQIMLGTLRGDREVGVYAVAAQLSAAGWFVPHAIVTAVFPKLIRLRESASPDYPRRLQQLFDGLFGLGLAVSVLVSLLAVPAVAWIYGEPYRETGVVLQIHIWSAVFVFMRAALSKWLIVEEAYIFSLVTHGFGALTNVALNAVLIPSHGTAGAAVATVISYAMAAYLALFVHPRTRPVARMMTLALLAPLRWPWRLLVARRGQGG